MQNKTFPFDLLRQFAEAVFLHMGSGAENARQAALALLSADLRGVDSHGIARLSGYVRLWQQGRVNTAPEMKIAHETPSTALLDADAALGLLSGPFAMRIAVEKAAAAGTGWVAVKNSNHFGIAGFHAMLALPHDMIGMAMTNASATVAPTFSQERLLGTNPIAVAIPAGKEHPFVADFATTTAANGKLEILQRKNEDAPAGWVQDQRGNPSNDAHALKKGGALLPLGGDREHGSHKGYMLGSIVDIFSGILSGANFGPWVPPFPAYLPMPEGMPGEGIGHFFGAMRIDAFRSAASFKADMDTWIQRFAQARPVSEKERVIIPGEPERIMEEQRLKNGIPLMQEVVDDLRQLAQQLQCDWPA
jgi:LDH2 family malate/lactate/ureidoglycolate dehydrogenase